jgi:hypothetical protein
MKIIYNLDKSQLLFGINPIYNWAKAQFYSKFDLLIGLKPNLIQKKTQFIMFRIGIYTN